MHPDDQSFLERLGGQVGPGKSWKVFQRNGRVLLVMPASASSFIAGSKLYSPQRKLAKIATRFSLTMPFVWRAFPSFDWQIDEKSSLGQILEYFGVEADAILLGNPAQEARRILILTKGPKPIVLKIGVGEPAISLVRKEAKFIEAEEVSCQEMSGLIARANGKGWECFGIPYLKAGEVTLEEICKTLDTWWCGDPVAMSSLDSWSLLKTSTHKHAEVISKACAGLQLRPARLHGDLAPWNVRSGAGGKIKMIDWEGGAKKDVPCWDALHFVFQKLVLIDRCSPRDVYENITNVLKRPSLAGLLAKAGWGGHEDLFFASYLIAMATEKPEAHAVLEMLHVDVRR